MTQMVLKDQSRPISVIHHLDREYRPHPKTNIWEIDPPHVAELRAFGLVPADEALLAAKAAASDDKDDEIARLKARVAELEDTGKKKS